MCFLSGVLPIVLQHRFWWRADNSWCVVWRAWRGPYSRKPLRSPGFCKPPCPILYTGFVSVGFAYTGQVVGQRYASAADAAIILSAETLFAAMFSYLLMSERLNATGIAGCALIFVCIVAVQMAPLIAARGQARLSLNERQS